MVENAWDVLGRVNLVDQVVEVHPHRRTLHDTPLLLAQSISILVDSGSGTGVLNYVVEDHLIEALGELMDEQWEVDGCGIDGIDVFAVIILLHLNGFLATMLSTKDILWFHPV